MQTWMDMAADSLEAAKQLQQSGHARSSLSRAYYSVYAAITGVLQSDRQTIGQGIRQNPGHEQLVGMAFSNLNKSRYPEPIRRRIAREVRGLYRMRVEADYIPGRSPSDSDTRNALSSASWILKSLEGVA